MHFDQAPWKSLKLALLMIYLAGLLMFFSSRGSGSPNAFRGEIGYPSYWLLVKKEQNGTRDLFMVSIRWSSAAWLILGAAVAAYYFYCRMRRADGTFKPGDHTFMTTWLPFIFALLPGIVCGGPLILSLFRK